MYFFFFLIFINSLQNKVANFIFRIDLFEKFEFTTQVRETQFSFIIFITYVHAATVFYLSRTWKYNIV